MRVVRLSDDTDIKKHLSDIGVDAGGVDILYSKALHYLIHIKALYVGGANILKQDALSIGADLAVPKGCVTAEQKYVDCILIASKKHLKILAKKELAQPFGLKELALKLNKILKAQKPKQVKIMGIINANDDSFFEGSRFKGKSAIQKIISMAEDGADIIDIGGVSSRPNAPVVSGDEELLRVKSILDTIKEQKLYEDIIFSIDSYTPKVVEYAMECGFGILNDITGLQDDEVCKICAKYGAVAVIMHMQGNPQTMQNNPQYDDILSDIYDFFTTRMQKAESFGIKDVVLDVGIGFGKTLQDNLKLIKHLEHFLDLGKEILVGASRKSMIDMISPATTDERLAGSLALHMQSVANGASYIRVHDVKEHAQMLRVYESLKGV